MVFCVFRASSVVKNLSSNFLLRYRRLVVAFRVDEKGGGGGDG